jgi:DNA-binding transcriptional MerR regulator
MISSSTGSYMTIGAFALSSGLSIEALRHYHELELLVPAHVDPATAYRRYSADQLPRAQAIRRLRSLDMTLDQIAEVLAVDDPALVRDSLERQKRHLVYTAKLLRLRTDQIDRLIERGSVMPSETGPRVIGMTVMGPDVEALRAFSTRKCSVSSSSARTTVADSTTTPQEGRSRPRTGCSCSPCGSTPKAGRTRAPA